MVRQGEGGGIWGDRPTTPARDSSQFQTRLKIGSPVALVLSVHRRELVSGAIQLVLCGCGVIRILYVYKSIKTYYSV
jgi:hypothetical protein